MSPTGKYAASSLLIRQGSQELVKENTMNKHDPFALMMDEHKLIAQAKHVIVNIDGLWDSEEVAYGSVVVQLLDFFNVFSDQYHHHKEERLLFPALSAHQGFVQQDIIVELEEHHQQFRDYSAQIKQAVSSGNFQQTQSLLTTYIDELLDHIAIEDDELFIICQDMFTASEQERLYFQFIDIDNELGLTNKKALVDQFQELVKQYAN